MIYIGIIAAIGLTSYFYWRTKPVLNTKQRILLGILRFLSLTVILTLLFNPIYFYYQRKSVKPSILLLVDNSGSMQENCGSVTKYDIAVSTAEEIKEKVEGYNYEAGIFEFAGGLEGNKNSSLLSKTLVDLVDQNLMENVEELFLFSDGWFDDEDPEFISNIHVPLNVYDLDFTATGFDLEITDLNYNQKTWFKESTPFVVEVKSQDFSGDAELNFIIENELIESRKLDFAQEKYQQQLFEYEFREAGLKKFYFEVVTDSLAELKTENNLYPGAILVVPDKARILVISEGMNWDGRFLVQAVKKNERFEVDYLLKKVRLIKEGRSVSLSDELSGTEVLCLINKGNIHFNNAEAEIIKAFVEKGGGLLLFGKVVDDLGEIMPATGTGITREFEGKFLLTKESINYQSLNLLKDKLDEIPPVKFFYSKPRLNSKVLAEFQEEQKPPALVFQEYMNGKILFLSFYDLWKWQLRGEDDNYLVFTDYLLQWLSYDNADSFTAWSDQNSYLLGENVKIILQAFDEKFLPIDNLKAAITIEPENGKSIKDFMTRNNDHYSYCFPAEEAGEYSVLIRDTERGKEAETVFVINDSNGEIRDRGVNRSLLAFLSEETGGQFFSSSEKVVGSEEAEIKYDIYKNEIPLYRKWYTIAIFLLAFSLEIFLRKRWGLL